MKPPRNPLENAMAPADAGASFRAERYGGIALLIPLTYAAETWIKEHLSADAQWIDDAVAVELRYFPGLVDRIIEAGFLFERDAYPN